MKERVLYALTYGPCDLKTSSLEIHKDDNTEEVMNVDPIEVKGQGNFVRKEEKLTDLDCVINEIQNKFF